MVVDRVNEHFSILDEYERRRIETLFVGFGTRFPGKFENQLKNQRFIYPMKLSGS